MATVKINAVAAIIQMLPGKELQLSKLSPEMGTLTTQSNHAEYSMVYYGFGLMRMSLSRMFDGALRELFKLNRPA